MDPVEGGCANDYTYVYGDPINQSDLSGRGFWEEFGDYFGCVLHGVTGIGDFGGPNVSGPRRQVIRIIVNIPGATVYNSGGTQSSAGGGQTWSTDAGRVAQFVGTEAGARGAAWLAARLGLKRTANLIPIVGQLYTAWDVGTNAKRCYDQR